MRNWLPLCFACFTAAVIAAPVQAQYIYLDVDGDQKCTSLDFPPFETGHIDVWLDTAHNGDGEPATCATGEDLSMDAYELVFNAVEISIIAWANLRPEFPQLVGIASEGNHFYVGFSSGGTTFLPPGLYKLGSMTTSSSNGCSVIQIMTSFAFLDGKRSTGFQSQCLGADGDYAERLGEEFADACGINRICDGAEDQHSTTWGKIKQQYLGR